MTMLLEAVQAALAREIALAAWAADNEMRGGKVDLFRRYANGEHDANLTPEMRKLLRIDSTRADSPFNANQCDNIIQSVVDRLQVTAIEGDSAESSKWSEGVLNWNRFDALQLDVHEATIRDGDSYVLVEFDNEDQMPRLCHEPAWDGICGMLVIHRRTDKSDLAAAVKIWQESKKSIGDTVRVNIYYPDRIEKYIGSGGSNLQKYADPDDSGEWPIPWVDASGEPLGVPVVQFRNRAQGTSGYGKSELEDGLPLQDALNRTLFSMVMAAELSAFQIRWAKGFAPPSGLTPGMWITIGADGMNKEEVAEVGSLDQGDIAPFIEQATFLIEQIEAVTRTPRMSMGTNLSGEALKQMEVKLLGKVRRFQIKGGNAWEDVMSLAARVATAYGTQSPPVSKIWRARWASPEMRNDTETITNAKNVADKVGLKRFLKLIAPVYEFTEDDIQEIMADVQSERGAALSAALGGVNKFQ